MGRRRNRHSLGLSLAAACLVLLVPPGSAAAARPDLKIAKLTAGPAQARAADPILVVDTTTNTGKGKAKRSENGYYLSRDETAGDDDELLGRRSVKKLKRRKRSEGAQELTIPADASGNYQLIACADDAVKVKEKNEQNNCRASEPITVVPEQPPPDDNQAPFANLDYSPAVPETGEQVQFTSLSTDPDGAIAELAWDLDGDGAFDDATGASPSQAYGTAGTHTVGLRATDDEGVTDVDLRELTVVDAPDPDLDDDGTLNESDCEPNDPLIHPAAADLLEAPYTDSNCDGVDGVAVEAIYVSPDGINNAAAGLTRSNPVATIDYAIGRAVATSRSKIFIAGGTYEEAITVVNGISMYGGFAPGTGEWGRSAGNPTTILNRTAAAGNDVTGLLASSISTATRLQLLRVVAGSATGLGGSSYGIRASNSPALTLDTVTVEAGNGAAGATGGTGTDGADGANGGDGNPGLCATTFAGGSGGTQGAGTDGATNISGGTGGAGGSPGQNGSQGGAGSGPSPGSAGTAGTSSTIGGDGGDGGDGADGSNGAGGNGGGVVSGKWSSGIGGTGSNGAPGSGGGGGGGGPGINSPQVTGGPGGGGGAAGGRRGTGGGGATGGGGSFGLFITNSVSSAGPTVLASTIRSGDGGSGGIGGIGAPGGIGGLGGDPGGIGPGCTLATVAGSGGDGGDGGDGGHGGGGAGGPSIGIFTDNVAPTAGYLTSGNTFDHGSAGVGGPSLGNAGSAGSAANTDF